MQKRWGRGAFLVWGLVTLAACKPEVTAPPPPEDPGKDDPVIVDELGPCEVGRSPMRRLTRREFDNTVRDLLGDTTKPAQFFPEDEIAYGFNNNADAQSPNPVLVERYIATAEDLAHTATEDLDKLVGCDVAAKGEETCARQFIEQFGLRAFRRPLTPDDISFFVDVYNEGRAGTDFRMGISQVLAVMLLSPEFLYRIEEGTPVDGEPGVYQLDGYEIATRLSYFFWGTTPDDGLLAAAARGELDTEEGVVARARQMVKDPRARETVIDFHTQWLELVRVDEVSKDTTVFPDFDPLIRGQMRAEAEALIDDLVWSGSGDVKALFTARHTYLNQALAKHYGVPGITGKALRKVELPERGAGLLTLGALMAVHAHPDQTSPVNRGKFVREQLLCMPVPPPPENVVVAPPSPDPKATTRDRFTQHRQDPACSGCHQMMDPIGFGFEKFDALGRHRDTENGLTIDDTGTLASPDIGQFRGIPELAAKLVETPELQQCVARQWFRYAQGRVENTGDLCTVEELHKRFADSGLKITDVMVEVTRTRPFRFRTNSDEGGSR